MDTLRTGRTEHTARGENEPLAAKPGEKCGPDVQGAARVPVDTTDDGVGYLRSTGALF